jgi:hypothetical protein
MAKKKKVAKARAVAKGSAKGKSGVRRYENVLFEFPDDDMQGTVVVRGNEMVLDIPEQNGLAAALIVGKREGQIFRGKSDVRDKDALKISAAWCDFGEVFAGVWLEEDNELLFLFRLPR